MWGKASQLLDPHQYYIGTLESVQDISDYQKTQEFWKNMQDKIDNTFLIKYDHEFPIRIADMKMDINSAIRNSRLNIEEGLWELINAFIRIFFSFV